MLFYINGPAGNLCFMWNNNNIMNQNRAPLFAAVKEQQKNNRAWLHVPAHGGGRGLPAEMADSFLSYARWDVTELPGLDDLHNPVGAIAEAQALAAALWGADQSYFLVNGSTAGILAMILACCGPGDTILLPRNAHSSVVNALILSGATPQYIPVSYHENLPFNVTPSSVAAAFDRCPQAKALLLSTPSYYGICADLRAIAAIVRDAGRILLVDEAHGAHLGFHEELPASPRHLADLCVQSWHKTLGALTPGAMLHRYGHRIDSSRLGYALRLVQTSSPSYPVMVSLDAVRKAWALNGERIAAEMLGNARQLRDRLQRHVPLLTRDAARRYGFDLDETKITVLAAQGGFDGFAAARFLASRGLNLELVLPDHLLAVVGPGYQREWDVVAADAFSRIPAGAFRGLPMESPPIPEFVMPPREAFYAEYAYQAIDEAAGHVAAATVACFPPGIPLLNPGERISMEVVDYVNKARNRGVLFNGLDSKGRVRIVKHEVNR